MPSVLRAQLQVTSGGSLPSGWTADSLVRNVLLGEGVEVSNCQFNGSSGLLTCNAIGRFTTGSTSTNLGIDAGIVMATGPVTNAIGPNNSGSAGGSPSCSSYNYTGNSRWDTIKNGNDANDVAVLEFNFVPRSDSIKFSYVFGSEEYPEYVNAGFNDAFAFFLTGINPNGGMYNNKNIALVPNTNVPITIDNVNVGSYSQYYVNNTGTSIQYDAFTTVLTAEAKVLPCSQYHLTLVIADLGDAAYDSGVFLEAHSLRSNPIRFSFTNPANPQNPTQLYEGCCAEIHLQRPYVLNQSTQIGVSVEGTATNGGDFDPINPFFFFPSGQDTMSLRICPYQDFETEGNESVKFVMSPANGCARSDSVEFTIIDTDPLHMHIERDTLHSASTTLQMRAVITGGMPNRTVTWKRYNAITNALMENLTGEVINVNPRPDSYFCALVEDFCYNYAEDTILVGVRTNFARLTSDTVICQGEPLDLGVTGADSVAWFIAGSRDPMATGTDSLSVAPEETTKYKTYSYLWWNGQWWEDIDSVTVHVVPAPDVQATISPDRVCEGQSVTVNASGVANYSWDGGATYTTITSHNYVPDSTRFYIIYGKTTTAECFGRDTVWVTVDTMPVIHMSAGAGVCDGEEVSLTATTDAPQISWTSSPTDPTLAGQASSSTIVVNPAVTTKYILTAVNGTCTSRDSTTVAVEPSPVAIGEVTPQTVSLGNMEAEFHDLSQNTSSRRWVLPDGSIRTEQTITYVVPNEEDSVTLMLWAYNPYMCFDTTRVTVYVDHTTLWTPNIFTPDENTNQTFLVKYNDIQEYHIFIYDRAGRLVFESRDPEQPWDGTYQQNGRKCPQGAYVYLISYHKITYPYDQVLQKGTVLLIR